jgi:uncharacterized protein (UPF0332 family)
MQGGFDPRRFLKLAKQLANDPYYQRDSRARTAMCRIYYAAFLVALQKLQEKGIPIQDDDKIHQAVIETYKEKRLSSIADGLDQLREKRVDSDYHMMVGISIDLCNKYAEYSEYIIGPVEQVKELR